MMKLFTTSLLAAIIGVGSLTAIPASAKDWIESVKLSKAGIDIPPYEVMTDGHAYKSIRTKKHTYSFELYAKATNGERIVAAALSSMSGAAFFEAASPEEWSAKLSNRDVGSGGLRTWKRDFSADVPTSKVNWKGRNPVQLCNDILVKQMSKGMTAAQVFSKTWDTKANAFFQMQALAAHKNKAKNNKWNAGNTSGQSSSLTYPVFVKCQLKK